MTKLRRNDSLNFDPHGNCRAKLDALRPLQLCSHYVENAMELSGSLQPPDNADGADPRVHAAQIDVCACEDLIAAVIACCSKAAQNDVYAAQNHVRACCTNSASGRKKE